MSVRSLLTAAILLLVVNMAAAQIHISPCVPAEQMSGFDANVASLLENKLKTAISQNGMVSATNNPRFVMAGAVSLVGKEALPTAPPKVIVHLSLNLAVGDVVEGKCYGSRSVEITGVGSNDNQAVTNAVKRLNTKKLDEVGELLQLVRQRVVDYYNAQTPTIIANAQAKVKTRAYEEAIYMLAQIPQECDHYQEAVTVMRDAYMTEINDRAATALQEAKAMWSGNPSCANASQVVAILATIDVNSNSIGEAQKLQETIANQCQFEAEHKREADKQRMANQHEEEMLRMANQSSVDVAIIDACARIAESYDQRSSKTRDLAAVAQWLGL